MVRELLHQFTTERRLTIRRARENFKGTYPHHSSPSVVLDGLNVVGTTCTAAVSHRAADCLVEDRGGFANCLVWRIGNRVRSFSGNMFHSRPNQLEKDAVL